MLTHAKSCLYHTINILLNRAMLKLGESRITYSPTEHNPLIQCISSATSIIALFDLYTSNFGYGHVVLSLAYSVYTAASIFLLEVQAMGHGTPGTLDRLAFCIEGLKLVQTTTPGQQQILVSTDLH